MGQVMAVDSRIENRNLDIAILVRWLVFKWVCRQFVPLSLSVTVELVKILQSRFVGFEIKMYDIERNMPAKVHTSNLLEELGQVEYIFSDKTGTLTCNIMEFKKLTVGSQSYGLSQGNSPHISIPLTIYSVK